MRFAWLRSESGSDPSIPTGAGRMLFIAYNAVWWIPAVLPILGIVSYRDGSLWFLLVTTLRAAVNLYRNNILPIDKAEGFVLRSP